MASKDPTTTKSQEDLPFGTIQGGSGAATPRDKGGSGSGARRKKTRRKGTSGNRSGEAPSRAPEQEGTAASANGTPARAGGGQAAPEAPGRPDGRGGKRRSGRRGGKRGRGRGRGEGRPEEKGPHGKGPKTSQPPRSKGPAQLASGMFVMEKGGFGVLRRTEAQWRASREDIYVPKRLIDKEQLRDGALVEGHIGRGQKHKHQLVDVQTVDGKPPGELRGSPVFKNLTSIDPDFHYAIGDITGEVSMRIVDLLCPVGRGQRGLIVAPPRSGKTTLMRQFAHGLEKGFPEVHLMVLLVDERPEEATEWTRSVDRGQVFVSTADETAKNHIQLAEAVWMRACRLVELGEDVVILLDSITRLARAYNNQAGAGGRTMSGGLDSRAMERPRKIFGSARNTENAGSLTILGTTLIETGSRLDQLVFEEFKGTGNMELVLARKLADRRIFPAIDVERSGTRKEEKLVGMRRLKLIHTLRRVLSRMNFIEAMELLITKLEDVEKTDDFLTRFEIDPDA